MKFVKYLVPEPLNGSNIAIYKERGGDTVRLVHEYDGKKVGSVETFEHNYKKMISGRDDPYESLVYLLENIFEYRLYYSKD
jgi:hypothetical protein